MQKSILLLFLIFRFDINKKFLLQLKYSASLSFSCMFVLSFQGPPFEDPVRLMCTSDESTVPHPFQRSSSLPAGHIQMNSSSVEQSSTIHSRTQSAVEPIKVGGLTYYNRPPPYGLQHQVWKTLMLQLDSIVCSIGMDIVCVNYFQRCFMVIFHCMQCCFECS